MIYTNPNERAIWEQGRTAGLKKTMTGAQCRNVECIIFRDGWREGMLQRLLGSKRS